MVKLEIFIEEFRIGVLILQSKEHGLSQILGNCIKNVPSKTKIKEVACVVLYVSK